MTFISLIPVNLLFSLGVRPTKKATPGGRVWSGLVKNACNIIISLEYLLKMRFFLYNFAKLFFHKLLKMYGETTNFVCSQ